MTDDRAREIVVRFVQKTMFESTLSNASYAELALAVALLAEMKLEGGKEQEEV